MKTLFILLICLAMVGCFPKWAPNKSVQVKLVGAEKVGRFNYKLTLATPVGDSIQMYFRQSNYPFRKFTIGDKYTIEYDTTQCGSRYPNFVSAIIKHNQ